MILMMLMVLDFIGSLDYSCTKAPAPVSDEPSKDNTTIFDRNNSYPTLPSVFQMFLFFLHIFMNIVLYYYSLLLDGLWRWNLQQDLKIVIQL